MFWVMFIYGLVAGWLLVRLKRHHSEHGHEWNLLLLLGWLVLALSLALAAVLLCYALWLQLRTT